VKKRIPKNFIFIPFWLFLKINRKYFNSRARLVASLGIERNIQKIMDLLALAVEGRGKRRMLRFFTAKRGEMDQPA
jgi:hypothetical protein